MKRGYLVRRGVNSGWGTSVDHGENSLSHDRHEKSANKKGHRELRK